MSYGHRDAAILERLLVHLAPVIRLKKVDFWVDTALQAGQEWREEIEDAIEAASVAIVLVSADFFASEFIASVELPRLLAARQRGLTVIPLFLTDVLLETVPELAALQGINQPTRPLGST